ncbi:MAG: SURF1 family protein [Limnobacter sp.]|nr:SURF1 family protein [Limnobacter sp.]
MVDAELKSKPRPTTRPELKPVKLLITLMLGFGLGAVTFNLGQWQTDRAQQKLDLHQRQVKALNAEALTFKEQVVDVEALSYRKVEIAGQFDPKALVYIDNRQVTGRPAVQVIQGFKPEGSAFLIPVDRGLLLRNPQNPREAPPMPTDSLRSDETSFLLKATLLPRFAQSAELWGMSIGQAKDSIHKDQSVGYEVWSNFSAEEFQELTKQHVSNYVLTLQPMEQTSTQASGVTQKDGFYLSAVKLPEQVAKHKGYAFQWYAMTTVLILLTLFFTYREFFARVSDSKRH